jgi:hypothetical protein
MFRRALLCAVLVTSVTAAPALASPGHNHNHRHRTMTSWSDQRGDRGDSDDSSDDDSDDSGSDDSTDATTPDTGTAGPAGGVVASGTQSSITAELTGYSFQDNTPPGSATISMPVLHSKAGGTGTYADPVTTAVPGSASSPETPKGTRLYIAKLKRYFIVEDSGATKEGTRHFDLWVDGQGFSKSASDKCMDSYTGTSSVILNPPQGEPVTVGPLTGANGCRI